jgi:hypothetical protein
MKKNTIEVTSKVCKSCDTEKPIEDFRLHKSGYRLGKCYVCEKLSWKSRTIKQITFPGIIIPMISKSGEEFDMYTYPVTGTKKVSSKVTEKVLYVPTNISRDVARSLFQKYANVPRNTVSVTSI